MKTTKIFLMVIFIVFNVSVVIYANGDNPIQATKVQYPIIKENEQVKSEIPMVCIDDRIYLPIRALCDILDIGIEWKEEGKIEIIPNKKEEITKDFNLSKDTILKIADSIFLDKFGQEFMMRTIVLVEEKDDTYEVCRWEPFAFGGDITIIISKTDGRIVDIIAGE